MDLEEIRKNKLKMILQFSVPSIIAMLLTSCITVADGFFIGNYIGKDAIAAVNLGLPIIYLFLALSLMISVGGSSIGGRLLGAQKFDECRNVFNQSMATVTFISVSLSVVVFILFHPIIWAVGAKGIIARYFSEYYLILLFELPIMVINCSFGMFIRGEGNPQYFMGTNILSVALNIVLDYVFAARLGWGVRGIAFASLIAAFVAFVCNCLFFLFKSKVFKFGRFAFSKNDFRETILNGSSEFIGEMAMCFAMYAYNFVILRKIGIDGITAFTIVGYVSYLFSMVIVGYGQGVVPLVSFAFGAKDFALARRLRKITVMLVLFSALAVMIFMVFALNWYSGLFAKDASISAMVRSGVLIYMFSFPLAGFNTILSFYFTSIGKAKESAVISSSRGIVVLLICIFTLPVIFGITGVWFVGPVTEGVTILLSLMYMYKERVC